MKKKVKRQVRVFVRDIDSLIPRQRCNIERNINKIIIYNKLSNYIGNTINTVTFTDWSWLSHNHDLEIHKTSFMYHTLRLFCTFIHFFLYFPLQESYSLVPSSPALRAVARGDTMLVIYRLKVTDNF